MPGVLTILGLLGIAWLIAARGLRGVPILCWLLVPVLAGAACLCVADPGRLFPKEPYEGPVLLRLTWKDGVTMLDLVGLTCAALAVALAIALIWWRLRPHERAEGPY